MEYSSTNTRDVDLGGGLKHKTGQDVADGRLGVAMATKHAEEEEIITKVFTVLSRLVVRGIL